MEAAGPFLPSSLPFLSTGCSDSPQAIGPLPLTTREKRGSRFLSHLLSIIGLDMVNIRFLVSLADTGSYSSRSNDATLGR